MCTEKIVYIYVVIPGIRNLVARIEVHGWLFRLAFQLLALSCVLCAFKSSDALSYLHRCIAFIGSSVELLHKSVSKLSLTIIVS